LDFNNFKEEVKIGKIKSVNLHLDSMILINSQQVDQLMKVCEFETDRKWELLYRGTRDGFSDQDFHAKCDGKKETLIIVKSTNGNIFGGYTSLAWDQSNLYKSDPS